MTYRGDVSAEQLTEDYVLGPLKTFYVQQSGDHPVTDPVLISLRLARATEEALARLRREMLHRIGSATQ